MMMTGGGEGMQQTGGLCERCGSGVGRLMPSGFRFHPFDDELIADYLRKKAAGEPLPFGLDDVIPTLRLYGPDGDPRSLFQRLPFAARHPLVQRPDEFYVFTRWEHCNAGGRPSRIAGPGTWSFNHDKDVVDAWGRTLGMMAHLTFLIREKEAGGRRRKRGKGASTHWVMHEYRLPDEEGEAEGCRRSSRKGGKATPQQQPSSGRLVLCRIRYTQKEKGNGVGVGDVTDDISEGSQLHPRKRRGGGSLEEAQEQREHSVASCSTLLSTLPPTSGRLTTEEGIRPAERRVPRDDVMPASAPPAMPFYAGEPPLQFTSCSTQLSNPATWDEPIHPAEMWVTGDDVMPATAPPAMPFYAGEPPLQFASCSTEQSTPATWDEPISPAETWVTQVDVMPATAPPAVHFYAGEPPSQFASLPLAVDQAAGETTATEGEGPCAGTESDMEMEQDIDGEWLLNLLNVDRSPSAPDLYGDAVLDSAAGDDPGHSAPDSYGDAVVMSDGDDPGPSAPALYRDAVLATGYDTGHSAPDWYGDAVVMLDGDDPGHSAPVWLGDAVLDSMAGDDPGHSASDLFGDDPGHFASDLFGAAVMTTTGADDRRHSAYGLFEPAVTTTDAFESAATQWYQDDDDWRDYLVLSP